MKTENEDIYNFHSLKLLRVHMRIIGLWLTKTRKQKIMSKISLVNFSFSMLHALFTEITDFYYSIMHSLYVQT